ncbi:MFS transporter [Gloeobacter morelensis]|uniref:MFS transporter n=1 Tax=Gloeobacter morelensis MG652769 TaxID=2781736 RepID=A0ABY3PH21_9CYAN|nr:MFS transporter [Gloeobacter morelensis]UFP92931.1 MFS transporter [Gloeobacter morelensis MG652769]
MTKQIAQDTTRKLGAEPDNKWAILLAVSIGTFLVPLDITVVALALPDIESSLRTSFADLQWIINGYNLSFTAFLLAAGTLADRFGRRRLFLVGLALFTLTSLTCGLASTPLTLTLARSIQGLGGALLLISSLAILSQTFRAGPERANAFGVWGLVMGVGASLGPMIGGLLVDLLSWRWIFLLNVPIGVGLVAFTLSKVDESRDPGAARVDWLGLTTFTAALFSLCFALIQGNELGWTSTPILGLLAASTVLLVAFVIIERRQSQPMFELSLLGNPAFVGTSLLAATNGASFWAMIVYLPLFFQNVLGYSPLQSGLLLLPLTVPLLVCPPLGGRLAQVLPARVLLSGGMLMIGLGFVWMYGINAGSPWTAFLPGFLLAGIGAGLINAEIANVAIAVLPPERSGMGSGITSTFRHGAHALGIALLGSLLTQRVATSLEQSTQTLPGLVAERSTQLASQIAAGDLNGVIRTLPPDLQNVFAEAAQNSFIEGFNLIVLLAAATALLGAVATFVLVKDQRPQSKERPTASKS